MIGLMLSVLIVLQSSMITPALNQAELVVWNVGQGLWVTYIDNGVCHHFDIGGEKNKPLSFKKSLIEHCLNKVNLAYFSHWDWDHISLASTAKSWLPNLCIKAWPQGPANSKKKSYLASLSECKADTLAPNIRELKIPIFANSKPNQMSRVFIINDEILLPGDSPVDIEKKWREQISERNQIRILVLGHHGSRTSTSPQTLQLLPHLTAAISSSNPKRYGHPHPQVLERLKKSHVPIIKTVSWNSLHYLLNPTRPKTGNTTKH